MQGVNEPRSAQGAVGGGPSTFVFVSKTATKAHRKPLIFFVLFSGTRLTAAAFCSVFGDFARLLFQQQQQTFFSKLKSNFDHVMVYEDPNIQAKARSCIPVEDLTTKALHNLDNIKVSKKPPNGASLPRII